MPSYDAEIVAYTVVLYSNFKIDSEPVPSISLGAAFTVTDRATRSTAFAD